MDRDEIVAKVRAAWPEHAQTHGKRPDVLLERNAAYILDQDNTASGHHAARYILGTGA